MARDTDGDTLADALDTDADDDAVLDETDNCRLNANTQQEDFDLDGFGDVCDSDADGDGFEALGDCDDMNPFAASTGWDSDCDGYADDIGRVENHFEDLQQRMAKARPRQYCELPMVIIRFIGAVRIPLLKTSITTVIWM